MMPGVNCSVLGCGSCVQKIEGNRNFQASCRERRPKKRKINFPIIFVTSHKIMLIYETLNGATKCCNQFQSSRIPPGFMLYSSEVLGNTQDNLEDFDVIF